MRSAGCAINDWADRNFDAHVARTRDRPLAAGEISPREALAVGAVLAALAFCLVLFLNTFAILLSFVITITLRERAEETLREILDEGAGISDESLIRGDGMGLLSMRYRARLIGATLDVRRHPDGGTILTCRLVEGSRPEESARAERTDSRTTSPGEVGPGKRHAEP